MSDCLFCKIIAGEIPCNKKYEDEYVLAFEDIKKEAPVHILVVPKIHIDNILGYSEETSVYFNKILEAIGKITKEQGIDESGFRCVINTNDDGGQTVHHMHWHIIGKRRMLWPPG